MKIETFLYVGIILFIGAMFLPAIVDDTGTSLGYQILLIGWLAYIVFNISWVSNIAWLANVFYIFGFMFAGLMMYKTGMVLSAIAFIVGLQSYSFTEYTVDGPIIKVHYLGIGFYAWEFSFILTMIYCLILVYRTDVVSMLKQPKI